MADTCNCPPSPIPPWHRPVQTDLVQTITDDDTISLNEDTTYLDSTSAVAVTLPDGNYLRQIKRIYIKKEDLATTGTFTITGTFAGFTSITMNDIAHSLVLEWDGTGWQVIGGNAQPA